MTEGRKRGKLKAPLPEEDDEEPELVEGPTLESQFIAHVKFGDAENPGTHITLTQIDNWLKQAGVIQVRKLTRTDTGVCYFQFKKYKLDFDDFNEFIDQLASRKKIPASEIREKLIKCGPPGQEDDKKIIR